MSPGVHLLVGWLTGVKFLQSSRERTIVALAGVAPDIDGLGALLDWFADTHYYYLEFHQKIGHSVFAALTFSAIAAILAKSQRLAVFALSFIAVHLHILFDVISATGPEGYPWPIYYLYPLSTDTQLVWSGSWAINSWQNTVVLITVLLACAYFAYKKQITFLEIFNHRLDKTAVSMFHRYILRSPLPETGPDFSHYSIEQLRTTLRHIDAEVFPDDAMRLEQELNRRGYSSNTPFKLFWQRLCNRIIDMIHSVMLQRIFLITFFTVFSIDLMLNYGQRPLERTDKYIVTPTEYQCARHTYWEDLIAYYEFELTIYEGDYWFYALMDSMRDCKKMKSKLEGLTNQQIPLWHHKGMIYQLGEEGRFIRYQKQLPTNTASNRERFQYYYLMLFFIVIGLFYFKWLKDEEYSD